MLITLGSSTDLGRRESNQDSVLAVLAQNLLPRRPAEAAPKSGGSASDYVQSSALLILADGMGGRASGQLASETATKSVYRELAHTLAMQDGVDASYLEKALGGAIRQANSRIHQLAAKKAEAEGMGTTCTAALVMSDLICLGHVGDSRAYLFFGLEDDAPARINRQEAAVSLLTADHSVVAGEVRAGRLTEEEARKSRFRNVITRAVGVDLDVEPDLFAYPVPEGAVSHLVLTSDGLHGSVSDAEMQGILHRNARAPQRAANALVSAAKRAGATDNISVIVARIDATGGNYKEGAMPFDFESEEDRAETANTPHHAASEAASFWSRPVIWQIGCALLAFAAVAAWFVPGLLRVSAHPQSPAPPPVSTPVALSSGNPVSLIYSQPEVLLPGRRISPDFLLLSSSANASSSDVLVVDSKEERVLRVDASTGLVTTSIPEPSGLDGRSRQAQATPNGPLAGTDSAGDLYRIALVAGTGAVLNKYDATGKLLQAIDLGASSRPSALAVAPEGKVYFIDGGLLKHLPSITPV